MDCIGNMVVTILMFRLFLTVSPLVQLSNTSSWVRERNLDNRTSINGNKFASKNEIHCGRLCDKHGPCLSFFFVPDVSSNCELVDQILTLGDPLQMALNSVYYISTNAASPSVVQTTKSTTTPTATSSALPSTTTLLYTSTTSEKSSTTVPTIVPPISTTTPTMTSPITTNPPVSSTYLYSMNYLYNSYYG